MSRMGLPDAFAGSCGAAAGVLSASWVAGAATFCFAVSPRLGASTILGASLLMQVPTDDRILGYPAVAMMLFTIAILGGAALATWILVTDRKVARTEYRPRKDETRL